MYVLIPQSIYEMYIYQHKFVINIPKECVSVNVMCLNFCTPWIGSVHRWCLNVLHTSMLMHIYTHT